MTLTFPVPTSVGRSMQESRRSPRWSARAAAVASVGCLLAHVALLVVTGGSMLAMTLPMLALSGLCSACAPRLWSGRHGGRELLVMLCTGSAMVAAHLVLAPMHGGHPHVRVPPAADVLMHTGLLLAVTSELIAGAALARRVGLRGRRVGLRGRRVGLRGRRL